MKVNDRSYVASLRRRGSLQDVFCRVFFFFNGLKGVLALSFPLALANATCSVSRRPRPSSQSDNGDVSTKSYIHVCRVFPCFEP